MSQQDYTANFIVDQTPDEVFNAVNNVHGWWSENITGNTDKLGAKFTFRYHNFHRCTFEVMELVPGEKVTWHVIDSYSSFVEKPDEWTGTDVVFDITRKGGKTELIFTHVGLTNQYECYDVCSDSWSFHIKHGLYGLITMGNGHPNPKDQKLSNTGETVDNSRELVWRVQKNYEGVRTEVPADIFDSFVVDEDLAQRLTKMKTTLKVV